jgi:histone H3/H4
MSFQRLVREIGQGLATGDGGQFRWTSTAIEAIHVAAEQFLVSIFEASLLCCVHGKRVTVQVKDMKLACRLMNI